MAQVTANGITLEYDLAGPEGGPPVLVVMGFGTQLTSWPESFRDGLAAAGHRVIRFDNRDAGLSQKWDWIIPDLKAVATAVKAGQPGPVPYTLDDMAADALGLLDALGIGRAHVLGASMGGMIAQLMAIRAQERLRSLVSIMSTTSDPSLPRSSPEAQAALTTPPPSPAKTDVVNTALRARMTIGSPAYPEDEAVLRARIAASYDRSYYPEGQLRQWAAIMAAAPRTEALKAVAVPTLVLHGSADELIWPAAGRHTAACIPGAAYVEISGWGHNMPDMAVPTVLGHIVPFLQRVEAQRRG